MALSRETIDGLMPDQLRQAQIRGSINRLREIPLRAAEGEQPRERGTVTVDNRRALQYKIRYGIPSTLQAEQRHYAYIQLNPQTLSDVPELIAIGHRVGAA